MLKKIETLLTRYVIALLFIITGIATGFVVAAIYFIPSYTNTLTFADIGGMLAGIGTIGLLIVAIRTATAWKNQSYHQQKISALENYVSKIEAYYGESNNFLRALAVEAMHEPQISNAPTLIKNSVNYINELDQILKSVEDIEFSMIRINAIWEIEISNTVYSSLPALSRLKNCLKNSQSIFFTHNKALSKLLSSHQAARSEINMLYKQLND